MMVDLTYLREMAGDNKPLVREMIRIFSSQVKEFADTMDEYYQNKEYESLGKLAHKAKSSITIMGLNDLAKELKKLELDAKAGKNPETYDVIIDKFKSETEVAVKELQEVSDNIELYF